MEIEIKNFGIDGLYAKASGRLDLDSAVEYGVTVKNAVEDAPDEIKELILDFSEITFWLKAGFDAADHLEKIELELDRICLNLILYDNLHTFKPICELVKIKTLRYETRFEECLCIKDELKYAISVKSDNFYSDIAHGDSAILDKKSRSVYKQIFDIIQCPNLVIQYMALYDLLKDLACRGKKKNQQGVVNFFKNNDRYSDVKFLPSRRGNGNSEDNFTFLRNKIGHPWGVSADEIKELGINEYLIKSLLTVINDVLCGKCVL